MTRKLLPLFLPLIACGGPEAPAQPGPPPPPLASVSAPAPPSSAPPPAPSVAAVELPPPVARPSAVACSYKSAAWTRRDHRLTVAPGKPPFAAVGRAKIAADLVVGVAESAPPIFASLQLQGIVLEAFLEGPLEVRPAKPFQATRELAPGDSAVAVVSGGSPDAVKLDFEAPKDLVLVAGPRVSVQRPCDDVGLDSARFDAHLAFGPFGRTKSANFVKPKTALFDGPRGKKFADVLEDKASPRMHFIEEEKNGWSRVMIELDHWVVNAWVPSSDLKRAVSSSRSGGATGSTPHVVNVPPPKRVVKCSADVPLVARQSGERRLVGRVLAGTAMNLYDTHDGFTAAIVERTGSWAEEGVTFEVREADVAGCSPG